MRARSGYAVAKRSMTLLAAAEALALARVGGLPERWRMRVEGIPEAVLTVGTEQLDVVRMAVGRGPLQDVHGHRLVAGDVVCVRSAQRMTWRRVLAVRGREAFLRGDVAPFADGWFNAHDTDAAAVLVGRVRARALDGVVRLGAANVVRANWLAALALGRMKAAKRRLTARGGDLHARFRTRLLSPSEWPSVQAFWLRASGRELPLVAPRAAYVVGLFAGDGAPHSVEALVGVNVQLVTGEESYSAYT